MPVYDYLCARCGPFTEMRPMAECDLPHKCPECGEERAAGVSDCALFGDNGRRAAARAGDQ